MANRVPPLKNDSAEGYEEDFDPEVDLADVHGVSIQTTGTDDEVVVVTRDGTGNMTFEDQHNAPTSLSTITAGGLDIDKYLLHEDGSFVYIGDGDILKRA